MPFIPHGPGRNDSRHLARYSEVCLDAGNDHLTGGGNGMVLGGAGDDFVFGGPGDLARGDEGNDIVVGGAGLQQIIGGSSNDILTGGADHDRFDFGNGWGDDVVTDFQVGADRFGMQSVTGLDRFDQLRITDVAGGAEIAFGADSIFLQGVAAASLIQASFLL